MYIQVICTFVSVQKYLWNVFAGVCTLTKCVRKLAVRDVIAVIVFELFIILFEITGIAEQIWMK